MAQSSAKLSIINPNNSNNNSLLLQQHPFQGIPINPDINSDNNQSTSPTSNLSDSPTISSHSYHMISPSNSCSFLINSPTFAVGCYSRGTGTPTTNYFVPKFSIHHQDAEVSIADATDCLRMVSGKIDWFHRKHSFCPHLISPDDALQIAALHQKILIEEVPFLELRNRLAEGLFVDIPRELEGRVQVVCGLFDELKQRIDDLATNITPTIISAHQ